RVHERGLPARAAPAARLDRRAARPERPAAPLRAPPEGGRSDGEGGGARAGPRLRPHRRGRRGRRDARPLRARRAAGTAAAARRAVPVIAAPPVDLGRGYTATVYGPPPMAYTARMLVLRRGSTVLQRFHWRDDAIYVDAVDGTGACGTW